MSRSNRTLGAGLLLLVAGGVGWHFGSSDSSSPPPLSAVTEAPVVAPRPPTPARRTERNGASDDVLARFAAIYDDTQNRDELDVAAGPPEDLVSADGVLVDDATNAPVHIFPPTEAAKSELAAVVSRLGAEQPAPPALRAFMEDLLAAWQELLAQEPSFSSIDVEWECREGGCLVTTASPNNEQLQNFSTLAQDHPSLRPWTGPLFRSGPVQSETGIVEITWVFADEPSK